MAEVGSLFIPKVAVPQKMKKPQPTAPATAIMGGLAPKVRQAATMGQQAKALR